jgi:hypothetical protein
MPNNTCFDVKRQKNKSMIACPYSSQNAQTFENNLIISESTNP